VSQDVLDVVLFTGGRGSDLMTRELVRDPRVRLTLIVNGYDDGKSTGEVRRFLGDSLGPSDFRKNARRLAAELGTSPPELLELLAERLPHGCGSEEARSRLEALAHSAGHGHVEGAAYGLETLDASLRGAVGGYLERFVEEYDSSSNPFSFSDCSLGNLVFAGCFLDAGRDFNTAVARYCALLGLPEGLVENVTDGRNLYLIGLTEDRQVMASEADIVDATQPSRIHDIFLLDEPPTSAEIARIRAGSLEEAQAALAARSGDLRPNPRVLARLRDADLIIYAPGTQHSSLFPSYITPGVGEAIGSNLKARKLLVTNIQEDAETAETSAVEILDRAQYYLREKDRTQIPTPCLITHYVINDPEVDDAEVPYVRLGPLESLEDPRLVRIGQYEEAVSGRHDAKKVVVPFVQSLLAPQAVPRIAAFLLETDSHNKISQTVLESLRGGVSDLPIRFTFFYDSPLSLDAHFVEGLPFDLRNLKADGGDTRDAVLEICRDPAFDYVLLFESSGMYRGEDIVSLASHLTWGRLDAVWGSRRLSVRDIQESYKFRFRRRRLLGAISYLGSHLLSLAYLALYGRYITDTLSGIRAVRREYLDDRRIDLNSRVFNQQLLSKILSEDGEIFELPVRFLPISPKLVRRTTVRDGLTSILTIARWRIRGRPERESGPLPPSDDAPPTSP
jgi:2-phospho-L-lactate transferase/gluconeogenesis factor (CofD/UPF0052 family)